MSFPILILGTFSFGFFNSKSCEGLIGLLYTQLERPKMPPLHFLDRGAVKNNPIALNTSDPWTMHRRKLRGRIPRIYECDAPVFAWRLRQLEGHFVERGSRCPVIPWLTDIFEDNAGDPNLFVDHASCLHGIWFIVYHLDIRRRRRALLYLRRGVRTDFLRFRPGEIRPAPPLPAPFKCLTKTANVASSMGSVRRSTPNSPAAHSGSDCSQSPLLRTGINLPLPSISRLVAKISAS
jgi:hypothetical protein